jgi:histone H3/H4
MIHDAGAGRVSAGIVDEIGEMMEDYGMKLAKKAIMVAKFREDKTVRRKHIISALNIEKGQ